MSGNTLLNSEASITPPIETYVRASAAAAQSMLLPAEFSNQWITIQAESEDVYISFTRTATVISNLTLSLGGDPVPLPLLNAGCIRMGAGEERHFDLKMLKFGDGTGAAAEGVWINHISPLVGVLRFWRSSGPVR